jgi:putative ABC transport system ATP-binding protein
MLLVAESVSKDYPLGVRALDGVSLGVKRGEFLGIMGRSGSGKSTLLHILGALDRPTAGRVWIDGEELTRMRPGSIPALRLRKLGFVFQAHNLIPTLTALENVALPLRYLNTRKHGSMGRARAALQAVGLEDRMHHLPAQMSGGQQQRVAIARALVNDPALVLADEPTGALDSHTAQELFVLLRRLCSERGQTFIVVTHDPLVGQACDRVVTMVDGRIAL